MADKPIPLTKDGFTKLEQELDHLLTVERARVAHLIQEARDLAGAQNTGEYEDAKNEQAHVEGRILEIQTLIQNAEIIESEHNAQKVSLGSKVALTGKKETKAQYVIVGSTEADPKHGRISNESPLGKALIGKRKGDMVEIEAPAGHLRWTISRIS